MASQDGHSFSPYLNPRPDYGSFVGPVGFYIYRTGFRLPCIITLLVLAFMQPYAASHAAFASSPLVASIVEFVHRFGATWVTADDVFFTAGLSLAVGATWVIGNGFFGILDTFKLLQRYKLPRTEAMEPSEELVRKALFKEFLSHAFTGPLIMLFVAGPGLRALGSPVAESDFPSWQRTWVTFIVQLVVNEVMFYWGHRMLHIGPLYRAIHKQHHNFVGTRSFSGEYAHIIEDVLTAYIPFLMGLSITRAHFLLIFVYFFQRVFGVIEGHSGYCFKGTIPAMLGLSEPAAVAGHDYHHTKNWGNFGNPFYDWCFGTMDLYLSNGGMEAQITLAENLRAEGMAASLLELGAADGQKTELPILGKQKITAKEAKTHKCIIYKGAAYSISGYAAKHPGGEMMLTKRLGEDVTAEFEALGHSGSAIAILKSLYVADIGADTDVVADEEAGAKKHNFWSAPLKLTSSRQLTPSAWELVFQWEPQQEMLSLAPGSHVKLTAKNASKAEACSRSYTPIHFDAEARTVTLGIKFYERGEMSQLLRRAVTKGDEVDFSMAGPLGEISYEEKAIASGETVYSSSEHLVLIAGGTGITPFMAVLRAKKIASRNVTVVYCANATGDVMYEEELQALLPREYNLRILCPTDRETLSTRVVDAVSSCSTPSEDLACVVCGPPGMEEAVRVALTSKGFTQVLTSTSSALLGAKA